MTACIPRINLPWDLFADEETEAKRVCPRPGAQAGGIKLYKCVLKGLEPRSQWQGVFRAALPPEDPGRILLVCSSSWRLQSLGLWPHPSGLCFHFHVDFFPVLSVSSSPVCLIRDNQALL